MRITIELVNQDDLLLFEQTSVDQSYHEYDEKTSAVEYEVGLFIIYNGVARFMSVVFTPINSLKHWIFGT